MKSFNALLFRTVSTSLKSQTLLNMVVSKRLPNKILQKQSDIDSLNEAKNEHLIRLPSLTEIYMVEVTFSIALHSKPVLSL